MKEIPTLFRRTFDSHHHKQLAEKFATIPYGLDILLAHSPPRVPRRKIDVAIAWNSPHFGSRDLANEIAQKRPRFVFCGHIHTGDHSPIVLDHGESKTTLFNVSRLNDGYKVSYAPLRLEIHSDSTREAV